MMITDKWYTPYKSVHVIKIKLSETTNIVALVGGIHKLMGTAATGVNALEDSQPAISSYDLTGNKGCSCIY